jgi:hypothetical protein
MYIALFYFNKNKIFSHFFLKIKIFSILIYSSGGASTSFRNDVSNWKNSSNSIVPLASMSASFIFYYNNNCVFYFIDYEFLGNFKFKILRY